MPTFKVRDFRNKGFFILDDVYLNGYAKLLDVTTTVVYLSLCRHADKDQSCYPSQELIAAEHNINDRTVRRKISRLIKCNIIRLERTRTNDGQWANNTYFLLDKSEWLLPEEIVAKNLGRKPRGHQCPMAQPEDASDQNQRTITTSTTGHQSPIKDTHIKDTHKKDTHNMAKAIQKTEGYGNADINYLVDLLKDRLELPLLDGSDAQNRQYAYLCLKKFGGRDKVALIIEATARDEFWSHRIASFQKLYYKAVEIISKTRGGGNVVDISTD